MFTLVMFILILDFVLDLVTIGLNERRWQASVAYNTASENIHQKSA